MLTTTTSADRPATAIASPARAAGVRWCPNGPRSAHGATCMTEIEPGGSPTLRVDEHREPGLAQLLDRELREELVRGHDVGADEPRIGCDGLRDPPAHPVVAAERRCRSR